MDGATVMRSYEEALPGEGDALVSDVEAVATPELPPVAKAFSKVLMIVISVGCACIAAAAIFAGRRHRIGFAATPEDARRHRVSNLVSLPTANLTAS